MSAENKSLARRAMDELWTKGNLGVVDQLYSENCIFHDLGNPVDIRGRDGIKQFARAYRTACPDLQCTLEEVVAEGDKVVTRLRAQGRFERALAGISPTGKEMDVTAIAIHRIENGRIVEHWSNIDSAALMAQLGLISLPGPPPS